MNTKSGLPTPRILTSMLSLSAFSVYSMVVGLAGTIIITRHYSTEEFGIYTLVSVFVSFLSQISNFGLESAVPKFISGAKDEVSREHFFNTAAILRIGTIFLMSLLAWYGSPLLKILFGKSLLPGFIPYIPLLFAVDSFRTLLKATLQGNLLFFKMGISDLITNSTYFIFVIIIYALNGDITLLLLARALSSFLGCIYIFVSIPIRKRIYFQIDIFKELMKFGYPLQINSIMGFIYNRIDTIAVAMFLGPAGIATYEVARKIPDYLQVFYEPFRSVYYPFISKRYALDRPRAADLMNDAIRFVSFVTLLGVAIAALFGREILQFIFSQKYSPSAPVFVVLMFNLSISLISNVMGTTLVAMGDTKKPAIINFFNTVLSWLGSILLIPSLALIGAAIGNTMGTAVAFPLNRYFLRKWIEMQDMSYLKPIALFCVWGALVFMIKPESLLIKTVFLFAFLLACVFLSIITKKDIALLVEGSGISSWTPLHKLGLWISKL